jgi:hypothetical protein
VLIDIEKETGEGEQQSEVLLARLELYSVLHDLQFLDRSGVVQKNQLLLERSRVDYGTACLWIFESFFDVAFDEVSADAPPESSQQNTHNYNYMQTALLPLLLATLVLGVAENDDFLTFWPENYPTFESPTVPRALFVTSWNSQGRRAAISHANKFSTAILCLYDLRFD